MGGLMKKIAVWGTGQMAEGIDQCFDEAVSEIVCYVDSDTGKQGKAFKGKPVISPGEIETVDFDFIFISSVIYQNEIYEELTRLGVESEKIIPAIIRRSHMAKILDFVTEKGIAYFAYVADTAAHNNHQYSIDQKINAIDAKVNTVINRLGNPFVRSRHLYLKKHYEADAANFMVENFIEGENVPGKTTLFDDIWTYFDYVLGRLPYREGLYLEFGVHKGFSINIISERIGENLIYGFDGFEGMPEKWLPGLEKGGLSVEGKLPEVNDNVRLVKGWFDETLPGFVSQHKGEKCSFIHIDSDLYSSAKCVLSLLKDNIGSGTVICFDEFIGHIGWREDEYKAFMEFIEETGHEFRYIAACFFENITRSGERVAIEIL